MSGNTAAQRTRNRDGSSPERYTPPWLLQMIREFLGEDYLDPCPARGDAPLTVNGLAIPWQGNVYCNPPYGDLSPWVTKAMTEDVREIILLLPAYTDTAWFQPLFLNSICFIRGRLKFDRPRKGMQALMLAPHPSVLVYRGSRHLQFAQAFSEIGSTMSPVMLRNRNRRGLWREEHGPKCPCEICSRKMWGRKADKLWASGFAS